MPGWAASEALSSVILPTHKAEDGAMLSTCHHGWHEPWLVHLSQAELCSWAQITPEYINTDAAAYLNSTTGICNIPPANATFIHNISASATGQVGMQSTARVPALQTWLVLGHKSTQMQQ